MRSFRSLILPALLGLTFVGPASAQQVDGKGLEQWLADLRLTSPASEAQRERAVRALGELGLAAIPRLLDDVHELHPLLCARALAAVGRPAVQPLIEVLSEGDDPARVQRAAEALGELGVEAKTAIPALVRCLEHEDMWIRIAAVDALGRMGPIAKGAAPEVRRLLFDPWVRVPISAAEAFHTITGDIREPIAALRRSAHDVDESIRDAALLAMGRLGPHPEVITTLVDYLHDEAEPVRRTARVLLGSFGPKAVPALIRALEARDAVTRMGAALALSKMREESAPALEALLDRFGQMGEQPAVRDAAAYALGEIGAAALPALPALVLGLRDHERMVRAGAAQALGKIGDARAAKPLAGALSDEDSSVRVNAAQALSRLGPKAAPAVQALSEALEDDAPTVRRWAAQALGAVGGAASPAQDRLRRLEADTRQPEDVRAAARAALEILRR